MTSEMQSALGGNPTAGGQENLDDIIKRINALAASGPQAAMAVEAAGAARPPEATPLPGHAAATSRLPAMANARNSIVQCRGEDPDLQPRRPQQACPKQTCSFGELTGDRDQPFIPIAPNSLDGAGLNASTVEELIARYLLNRGEASGRQIADQLRLPFRLIDPILNRLKSEQMTVYRGANSVNDYTHSLTDQGRDRARRFNLRTTYYGTAPVASKNTAKR